MTAKEFPSFWQSKYPEADPINYELKWIYKTRWFRIHSLPDSKRYAQSEEEYQILLTRQNQLINDLVGEGAEIILLFGLYNNKRTDTPCSEKSDFGEFKKVGTLDLHKIRPEENEEETYFDIFIRKVRWISNKQNDLLKAIANDEIRMMFICPAKNRIIAPYDGGVDMILESEQVRDDYKAKYSDWLSNHPEGL